MARWVRWTTRLATYERDGWRCVWCDRRVGFKRGDRKPTLDHVVTRSEGGRNPGNTVTCCASCNQERGRLTVGEWLRLLDGEDCDTHEIAQRLIRAACTPLDRAKGRALCRLRFGRLV